MFSLLGFGGAVLLLNVAMSCNLKAKICIKVNTSTNKSNIGLKLLWKDLFEVSHLQIRKREEKKKGGCTQLTHSYECLLPFCSHSNQATFCLFPQQLLG